MVEAGQVLQNRYLIQKQIGAGGMGTVYLATDKRLNSPVAIKETLFTDDDLKRAFEREAQLLNSLRHSALPRVIDYFTEGDAQFLVMEYIAGEDLSKMLKTSGVFPLADVLRWADELLDALGYMHTQKTPVIHRDIKPQNLKLTPDGEIILLDFGLAKGKPGETSKLSKTNSVFGYSRSYAPLEQIQGTGTDPRSDLYSLTATLYHLLTGKPPADALSRATAYVNGQPDTLIPVEKLNPKVPASVSQVLSKGLELNAGLRPQSAEKMREALHKAVVNLPTDEEITEFPPKKSVPLSVPLPVAGEISEQEQAEETSERNSIEVAIPAHEAQRREAYYIPENAEELPQRSGWAKYAGIAATILILGGGSAAWYASNQTTAGKSGVNQTTNANTATADKKPETVNGNLKTAVANATPNNQNSETKTAEAGNANKSAANKSTVTIAAPAEKAPAQKPVEEEAPKPIIVQSAPPTAELIEEPNKDEEKRQPAEEEEQSDDSEDNDRNRRRRGKDGKPPDTRERRVNDNSSTSQKLPTILGAPPDN